MIIYKKLVLFEWKKVGRGDFVQSIYGKESIYSALRTSSNVSTALFSIINLS